MLRRMLLILCLFSLAALLTACSAEDLLATPTPPLKLYLPPTQPPEPTDPPTQPPAPTDTPAPPPTLAIDTSQVKQQLAQVEADTPKMRGLKPNPPVPEHFISKEQMGHNLAQLTTKNYSP